MLHSFEYSEKKFNHVGVILEVKRSMAWSSSLAGVSVGEMVAFEDGGHGRVSAIAEDKVEIMVLARSGVEIGTKVVRTGQPLHVTVGDELLGHTIDVYGHSFYDERANNPDDDVESVAVEKLAPGIAQRKAISEQLMSGVLSIDLITPLGKGQRELVMGDRKTGKSFFVRQTTLTQAKDGAVVVYGMIGKRDSEIKQVEAWLNEQKIAKRTILVVANASASPAEIFMTPYSAMAIAEHFAGHGKDVLLVLDDLSKHAVAYREMSLIGKRFPGRDSYPGDIFHVHSRLLERAGRFLKGSITCLPIVETVEGDITGYLQTNLMSMTDGHLYFDSELYQAGERPAVNLFLSVTRVGRQTQSKLARELAQELLSILKKDEELQRFLRFGSELTENVKEIVRIATGVKELFRMVKFQVSEPMWQYTKLAWLFEGVSLAEIKERESWPVTKVKWYNELMDKGAKAQTWSEWRAICKA